MSGKKKEKKFGKKLLHKYRLVVLNEDTFEERFAIKLTRLNVFVIVTLSTILLIAGTTFLIAFTSLKEYIPGYASTALKKQANTLTVKTDSLQRVFEQNDQYYTSIKKVLTGDISSNEFTKDSIIDGSNINSGELNLTPTKEDSILRDLVDREDKYNLFEKDITNNFILFPPVNGNISETYNLKEKHFAVDIVVAKDTPVKATADGTVIFSEWTTDTGYVVIIEHSSDLISVYKHNASVTKQQGDLVKSGEVIAMAGNSGELSTGPHLHFELWNKGYPVNPLNFIDFQ